MFAYVTHCLPLKISVTFKDSLYVFVKTRNLKEKKNVHIAQLQITEKGQQDVIVAEQSWKIS